MRRAFLVLAFAAVFVSSLYAQDPARELLANAKDSADIFTGHEFVIEADLSTHKAGNTAGGKYRLIWLGPKKWREDIVYGPDRLERIGLGESVFERSSSPMAGVILSAFAALAHFRNELDLPSEARSQLKSTKRDGTQCVEYTAHRISQTLCFAGIQLRSIKGEDSRPGENNESHWADYRGIFEKQFPFEWSTEYRGTPFFAHVQRISATEDAKVDPSWFSTDSSYETISSCFDLTPGRKVRGPLPSYPDQAKRQHKQGEVFIRATIDAQGTIEAPRVISPSSVFDAPSLEAVKQWKYSPPMCAGKPASTVTTIRVSFTLM